MGKRSLGKRTLHGRRLCRAWTMAVWTMTAGAALAWQASAAAEPALRFSVSSSWGMPYGRIDHDKLVQGIFLDISLAAAQKLGHEPVFIVLPRSRIEQAMKAGRADVRCNISPAWVQDPDSLAWSVPLFEQRVVLFGTAGTPAPASVGSLPPGTVIGTVFGFRYPDVDTLFDTQALRRDDAPDQDKVFPKVNLGRSPYGISDHLALAWYKQGHPSQTLAPWQLVLGRNDVHCAVPKASLPGGAQVLRALERLKKEGRIDAILRRYGLRD